MAKVFNVGGTGSKKDLVTVIGSGEITLPDDIGQGPYEFEFTYEDSILEIDDTPTKGSTNPVSSNGVYNAINALPKGGVTSFNGRSGAVSPQSGDYTAAQVGAYTKAEVNSIQNSLIAEVNSVQSSLTAEDQKIRSDMSKLIVQMTQAQYNALSTKEAGTLYVIVG